MWVPYLQKSFCFWFPFLFLFLLFLLPLEIRISFDNLRQDKGISLQMAALLWGRVTLFKLLRTFPAGFKITSFSELADALVAEKDSWYKSEKKRLQKIVSLVYCYMQSVTWKDFDLVLKIGTGDPAWTALLTGFLRCLFGWGSPRVTRLLSFKKGNRPRFLVYPSFQESEFVFLLSVEFVTGGLRTLYYVLKVFGEAVLGYQKLLLWRRSKKWKNIQSRV